MKEPDKICVAGTEYIRKDALLEWIDSQFNSFMEPDTQGFIEDLDEYINSL